jgi:UDP-GlcNAc3NAcA epimerase
MTGRMLEAIEGLLIEDRPDAMLVYGDTNSTLAGALAASKLHIPVIHIEAGLRSFNRRMPEEINRVLTDHVSSLLFCPTQSAVDNLGCEGITKGVHFVGDVNYDATLFAIDRCQKRTDKAQILADLNGKPFALCTIHRAENTDNIPRLTQILSYVDEQAQDRTVVLPLHPRTLKIMEQNGLKLKNARLIDPVGYFDMHALLMACDLVITDSGGVQKEAYFHHKPCITLRDETEWVETVDAGWNRLWTQADWTKPRRDIADYGTGTTAQTVIDIILKAAPLSV